MAAPALVAPTLHGWYSARKARETSRAFLYLTPSGSEVRVTEVTRRKNYTPDDPGATSIGTVTTYIGTVIPATDPPSVEPVTNSATPSAPPLHLSELLEPPTPHSGDCAEDPFLEPDLEDSDFSEGALFETLDPALLETRYAEVADESPSAEGEHRVDELVVPAEKTVTTSTEASFESTGDDLLDALLGGAS